MFEGATTPFSPIDNAELVVVEYAAQLERATSQVPFIVNRSNLTVHCSFDFDLHDEPDSVRRRFRARHPAG